MNREEFYNYIIEHFSISAEAKRLIDNILNYVKLQGLDEDEQYLLLSFLLDGIGLSDREIKKACL